MDQKGFTLVEIVIVLLIGSLLLVGFLSFARPYFEQQQRQRTIDAVRAVEKALEDYREIQNRYPCPAPLDSARNTAFDGVEECAENLSPGRLVRSTLTGRDGREVLIGAVPYRELDIPIDVTIDAYGNRLTYAVSAQSATLGSYVDDLTDLTLHSGAIDIVDGGGVNSMLRIPETEHFFAFSHGRNGVGAYTSEGVLNGAGGTCGGAEQDNCDNNASFVATLQSHGTAGAYYDDVSSYSLIAEGDSEYLWERSNINIDNIYNLNIGSVGIGTDDPQSLLDIRGEIQITNEDPLTQTTCASTKEGSIRYNSTSKIMEFCDGTNWSPMGGTGTTISYEDCTYVDVWNKDCASTPNCQVGWPGYPNRVGFTLPAPWIIRGANLNGTDYTDLFEVCRMVIN